MGLYRAAELGCILQTLRKGSFLLINLQEIRKIRHANDYKQMCNIQGNVISWTAVSGDPPYVEEYLLTVYARTIINKTPQYRDTSEIRATLPPEYPVRPPKIVMVTSPPPFHPQLVAAEELVLRNMESGGGFG